MSEHLPEMTVIGACQWASSASAEAIASSEALSSRVPLDSYHRHANSGRERIQQKRQLSLEAEPGNRAWKQSLETEPGNRAWKQSLEAGLGNTGLDVVWLRSFGIEGSISEEKEPTARGAMAVVSFSQRSLEV
jgi:hypothetical protein